jgi:hypothetical protein
MSKVDIHPPVIVADYGLSEKGEEDSIILKVRAHDHPAEIVLVFALLTDAQELHAQLGRLIAEWPKDDPPE